MMRRFALEHFFRAGGLVLSASRLILARHDTKLPVILVS